MPDALTEEHRLLSELVVPVHEKITSGRDARLAYIGLEQIPSRGSDLKDWLASGASISTNSVFRAGDTLFGKLRPNLRKCVTAPFDGYCSTDILVLRARPSVDPRFATRVFQSEFVGRAAEQTAIGTKMPRTSWEALEYLPVFCPESKEQKLIADILDDIDRTIRQAETALEKLKQVKQGLLHDLLTRGIDSNGELRPTSQNNFSKYTIGRLGALPKSWSIEQVHQVLKAIEAGKSPDCEDTPAKADEWGVLKVGAVNPEGFRSSENKVVNERRLHNPAYLLSEGDLLFSRANTYELVGMVSLVDRPSGYLMLSDKTLRLQVRPDRMTSTFLFWQLQHARSRSQIEIAATGTSGSMKNISQSSLERIWICRPPLDEQREIDARLAGIAKRCTQEEASLLKLQALKIGLMDDLLTGRVRVTSLLDK